MSPLYDKPVHELFRDMIRDINLGPGEVLTRERVYGWFDQRYPKVKRGTVQAHLGLFSTNWPSRVHHTESAAGRADLLFQIDKSHYRLYDPASDPVPIYSESEVIEATESEDAPEVESGSEFAYEKHLQEFLARHLHVVEPGLRLYEEEGVNGIEFSVGSRSIDILAVDEHNNLVVLELKVSRAYDRVIGQLLRYMGWIEKNLADPDQVVRGIIIAKEISEDLRLACRRISGVQLYSYSLSVSLDSVAID